MKYYINSIAIYKALRSDIKELIPDMTMRRRMSRVVKMGVSTAMEALNGFEGEVDAVITATGLGCLADSEKFLANIIENDEQMLNPTPFIQSTFNTVGAQVALLCKNHNYNMTYVHRALSFESALLDAMTRIDEGASHAVLVGSFDERTPTQQRIMERMGFFRRRESGEGSVFFVLTAEKRDESVAVIEGLEFLSGEVTLDSLQERYGDEILMTDQTDIGSYHTAITEVLVATIRMVGNGKERVVVINNYGGENLSAIEIRSI